MIVLLVTAFVVCLSHCTFVHSEFGTIYTAEMVESWDRSQTCYEKAEAVVRKWFHMAARPAPPRFGLQIGPALLGWSLSGHGNSYIYLDAPEPQASNVPRWEFALSSRKSLTGVKREDLRCEFYSMNDSRGINVFGKSWKGHAIQVPDGQVFFARLITNRSVVCVIQLGKTRVINDWGRMRVRFVKATNVPPISGN